ncbi:hypothetical protein EG68_02931 [Paragonimus skrjabini miyazakii]|uniref:Uncharacterized protein n=1 Tax=Paragonimus skrjabini miyazakii TaxID=59628 RepID=A0A8S9Z862_9TREM|nr:hypothetical protein EG68_02931 [Paragonimus skrjabini miyazakii]
MENIRSILTRKHTWPNRIPCDSHTCTHVFIRCDLVKRSVRPQSSEPFSVLSPDPKFFTIDRAGKRDTVSIDRLKVACVDSDFLQSPYKLTRQFSTNPPLPTTQIVPTIPVSTSSDIQLPLTDTYTSPPHLTTRTGRHIDLPTRFR